jgi:hypothetical protein
VETFEQTRRITLWVESILGPSTTAGDFVQAISGPVLKPE